VQEREIARFFERINDRHEPTPALRPFAARHNVSAGVDEDAHLGRQQLQGALEHPTLANAAEIDTHPGRHTHLVRLHVN
jgi:hypothetical protein